MFITQFIHEAVQSKPDDIAFICDGRETSYKLLKKRVSKIAGGLKQLRISREHPVGILALNSDKLIEAMLGTFWAGGVINAINTRWSLNEMSYVLNECEVEILFVDESFNIVAESLKEVCPSLQHIIFISEGDVLNGQINYEHWLENSNEVEDLKLGDDELAAVFYTGGTTGKSKGVMLSHHNIVSNAQISSGYLNSNSGISLQVAPLFHIGGVSWMMQVILRKMTLVILPSFNPKDVFAAIEQYKIKEGFFVPTMLQMIVNHVDLNRYDLSSLKIIVYGASAINRDLLIKAMSIFDNTGFVQFYGMTELSPIVTVLDQNNHKNPSKLKAGGYPISQCTVKIVDNEGKTLPANQVGEIVVKGSNTMMGYWKKPQETAKVYQDGWFFTGDGGYLSEDGFLTIADRLKDMIITGGENVYSIEVENAVLSFNGVLMCAVIGVPHEVWGEAIHAVVVPKEGYVIDAAQLDQYCRQHLAGFKCPRSFEFRTELPLSGAGKILKNVLRNQLNQTQVHS